MEGTPHSSKPAKRVSNVVSPINCEITTHDNLCLTLSYSVVTFVINDVCNIYCSKLSLIKYND